MGARESDSARLQEKKARPIDLAGLDLPNSTYYLLRDVFLLVRFLAVFFFGLLRALATFPSFCNRYEKSIDPICEKSNRCAQLCARCRAERATGFEPAVSAWKADALPLGDARAPAFYHRRAIAKKNSSAARALEFRFVLLFLAGEIDSEQR